MSLKWTLTTSFDNKLEADKFATDLKKDYSQVKVEQRGKNWLIYRKIMQEVQ